VHFFKAIILFSLIVNFLIAQPAYKFNEQGVDKMNKANYIEGIKDFDKAIAKDQNEFESYTVVAVNMH